jgi:hypothetical protein
LRSYRQRKLDSVIFDIVSNPDTSQFGSTAGVQHRFGGDILKTSAQASEFSMQKSSSSTFARQLIGVMTIPASWQAQ